MSSNDELDIISSNFPSSYSLPGTLSPSLERIPSHKWLVKYFELNNTTGQWNEGQTGYVYLDNTIPSQPPPRLIMTNDEHPHETLFSYEITNNIDFKTQRDTILTWKSTTDKQQDNLAISFKGKEEIEDIKECIAKIKGKYSYSDDENSEEYIIQTPTRENLGILAEKIQPGMNSFFYAIIRKNNLFFQQLGVLFNEEESKLEEKKSSISKETNDLSEIPINGNVENNIICYDNCLNEMSYIRLIFQIVKNLILSGDPEIIKRLLSDEMYLTTFGVFEYDFDSQKTLQHRQYFNDIVKFKNILEITNSTILENIHLNHRLSYLRDTAMGRFIDEGTSMIITNIIKQNDVEIVNFFINEKELLQKLINHIGNDKDLIMQKHACEMLIELMEAAPKDIIKDQFKKTVPNLYNTLYECDLLTILKGILRKNSGLSNYQKYIENMLNTSNNNKNINEHNDSINSNNNSSSFININDNGDFIKKIEEEIKVNVVQILINIVTAEPSLIRDYIKNKDSSLVLDLCNLILFQEHSGIKWEIDQSIINPMIISENGIIPSLEDDDYINILFDKGLIILLNYLSVPLKHQYKTEIVSTKQIIIDTLIHCIESYGNNIEEWLLTHNVLDKVLNAINDKHKIINLYIVKFIKCVLLRTSETFYENSLYDILDKCISLIKCGKHKHKEGVLLSAICDLFVNLKVLNIQKFNDWVNERKDMLYSEDNGKIFKLILVKGCEGIEKKIKEMINNEIRNFVDSFCGWEDFFKGNGVDEEDYQESLLSKKTHPSQSFDQIQNERDKYFIELTNPKSSLHNKNDFEYFQEDEIE